MSLQMLVSAVEKDVHVLAAQMNLEADAVIVNQCGRFSYEEYSHGNCRMRCYSLKEKGVGLSRNTALMRADRELCLFADEDIVYQTGYAQMVEDEFEKNAEADMLLFNVKVAPERKTYWNTEKKRIHWYNYGRYPAYSIAARTEALHRANVSFSLLFGGGARYSNGEDSLFLRDCLKKGLRIYASPLVIGEEIPRESTWFHGYNEKFFADRGVLYRYLYGKPAILFALRFLWTHRKTMGLADREKLHSACQWMKNGIQEAKNSR